MNYAPELDEVYGTGSSGLANYLYEGNSGISDITDMAVDFKGDMFWGMGSSQTDAEGNSGPVMRASADNAHEASTAVEVNCSALCP